jgi:hypothetical protein
MLGAVTHGLAVDKKAAVISDRTKTQCFAPALVQRNKLQKISKK